MELSDKKNLSNLRHEMQDLLNGEIQDSFLEIQWLLRFSYVFATDYFS